MKLAIKYIEQGKDNQFILYTKGMRVMDCIDELLKALPSKDNNMFW